MLDDDLAMEMNETPEQKQRWRALNEDIERSVERSFVTMLSYSHLYRKRSDPYPYRSRRSQLDTEFLEELTAEVETICQQTPPSTAMSELVAHTNYGQTPSVNTTLYPGVRSD